MRESRTPSWFVRVKAILRHYADAAALLTLLLSIVYLVFDKASSFGFLIAHPTMATFVALTIVFAGVLSLKPFAMVLRFSQLRRVLSYPPIAAAGVLCLTIALVVTRPSKDADLAILGVAAIIAGAVARDGWQRIVGGLDTRGVNRVPLPGLPDPLSWIEVEEPVSQLIGDKFNYGGLVQRLASLLVEGTTRSFGLTGFHGSGKSSVVHMVEHHLAAGGRGMWFVYIRAWGREVDQLPLFVLGEIVRKLQAEGLEVLSLAAWPAEYAREIMGTTSWLERAAGLCFRDQHSSLEILKRLDPTLDAVGKRIVVVVEDVDRTSDPQGMAGLCHLLDEFKQVRNVSFFFLKSLETETSLDFHRLCEHTEMMPLIPREELQSQLSTFVAACRQVASHDDLLQPERLDLSRLSITRTLGKNMGNHEIAWDVLAVLAHTPRSLKHALRRGWRVWGSLHGEVDLLELIIWSLLREGCPQGYAFLKERMSDLLGLPDFVKQENVEITRSMRDNIGKIGLSASEELALKAALALLGFNVSIHQEEYLHVGLAEQNAWPAQNIPSPFQSISRPGYTDYFRRLEAGGLDKSEVSDQGVIQLIRAYCAKRSEDLPSMIIQSSIWAEKVKQFGGLIPTPRLVDLIEDHVKRSVLMLGAAAGNRTNGFESLYRLLRERGDRFDILRQQLPSMLESAAGGSLELAHAVYESYETPAGSNALEMRNLWVENIKVRALSDESYLARVLNPDYPYALFHTLRYNGRYRSYNVPSDWQWLAPILVRAAVVNPQRTIPDIAHLFIEDTRQARRGEGAWFEFNKEYFERMVIAPELRASLVKQLLDYVTRSSSDDPISLRISYVKADLLQYVDGSAAAGASGVAELGPASSN